MKEQRRVWVIGAGAVGSVLAAFLHRSGRAAVILVGRSAHWEAVRAHGLLIETGLPEPIRLTVPTAAPDALPPLSGQDLVLLTGKLTRMEEVAAYLRARLGAETTVVALQNGLHVAAWIGDLMQHAIGRGLVYFGAHVPAPGRVRYYPGKVRVGSSPATRALMELLMESGIPCEQVEAFDRAEWEKLAINCVANPLAALLRVTNAKIGDPALDAVKAAILHEVRAVAAAEQAHCDLTVAAFNHYITGPTGGNTPSMAVDVARGEPTEIEHLNGAIVRLGCVRGVATPVNEALVTLITFLTQRA
jgi:2-dehydropantoate 2-reductase